MTPALVLPIKIGYLELLSNRKRCQIANVRLALVGANALTLSAFDSLGTIFTRGMKRTKGTLLVILVLVLHVPLAL